MNSNDLIFAKVRPDAIIPTKEDENAGYDIYANFDSDYLVIPCGKIRTILVPTGIACAVSEKYYLQVQERGSTSKYGLKYSAGVIDSGYRGEIFIALTNITNSDILISKLSREELIKKYGRNDDDFDEGVVMDISEYDAIYLEYNDEAENPATMIYPYSKAIAQLVVHEVPKMNVKEISYEELQKIPSKRGTGALGSSGK